MRAYVNFFGPSMPHWGQKKVLTSLDSGQRFILLRAGRKWRKTSLVISWLFENALETKLTCPYIAPSRTQAKNICWNDHVQRILSELLKKNIPYKKNEQERFCAIFHLKHEQGSHHVGNQTHRSQLERPRFQLRGLDSPARPAMG